ncbi:hypothetical protein HAX54_014038 [Datura stramonium]|uniref:Uncharacterized protein n=1 Tax=Datura stramonium TaxID=4076 RepID=A0ABS8TME4_DATST|nr:hypothetical protein [Datura stramonium]
MGLPKAIDSIRGTYSHVPSIIARICPQSSSVAVSQIPPSFCLEQRSKNNMIHTNMYSHRLCGLCQNTQVLRVGAVFASGFIRAIHFLEKHWTILCHDIRTGTNPPQITDPMVRESVMKYSNQIPSLQNLLKRNVVKSHGKGLFQDYGLIQNTSMYCDEDYVTIYSDS